MALIQGIPTPTLATQPLNKGYGDSLGRKLKNIIIGGDFSTNPWQRGTSFATMTDITYMADRFVYGKGATAVHTASKSADVPTVAESGIYGTHSLLLDCTTAQASYSSSDRIYLAQRIENKYFWSKVAEKPFTLSFWVKATKTGTYTVSLLSSDASQNIVSEYTINSTNTWEKKVITFPASSAPGSWTFISLLFVIAGGTDHQTSTLNTWLTDGKYISSNQVNGADSTSNDFRLAYIQLEVGSNATDFEELFISEVDMLCKRYFNLISQLDREKNAEGYKFFEAGFTRTTTTVIAPYKYPVPMRVAPSVTISSGSNQFHALIHTGDQDISGANMSVAQVSTTDLLFNATITATTLSIGALLGHRTGSSSYLALSAEL